MTGVFQYFSPMKYCPQILEIFRLNASSSTFAVVVFLFILIFVIFFCLTLFILIVLLFSFSIGIPAQRVFGRFLSFLGISRSILVNEINSSFMIIDEFRCFSYIFMVLFNILPKHLLHMLWKSIASNIVL